MLHSRLIVIGNGIYVKNLSRKDPGSSQIKWRILIQYSAEFNSRANLARAVIILLDSSMQSSSKEDGLL